VELPSDRLPALDLFSGGFAACSEALAPWFETKAYCENDEFRCRMDNGIPYRGKRIGALGDTNPPALYFEAFTRLAGIQC
jgi:hypothetical protein